LIFNSSVFGEDTFIGEIVNKFTDSVNDNGSPELDFTGRILLCFKSPKEPDSLENMLIFATLISCWLFLIFEPFGMRFRNLIMTHYYPARTSQRAAWLHRHILKKRIDEYNTLAQQRKHFGNQKHFKFILKLEEMFLKKLRGFCKFRVFPKNEFECFLCGTIFERSVFFWCLSEILCLS
jgi:DC-STAMP-like protein